MKRVLILSVFVVSFVCADYTHRLPATIQLQSGQSQTSKAIADCSSTWECVFGSQSDIFSYSTRGDKDSTLTINAALPQNPTSKNTNIPFYASTITIGAHSNLILNDFESLSVANAIDINGGSLIYSHNTSTSGLGTYEKTRISLNNAKFEIKAGLFTNYGTIEAKNNSTLNIMTRGGNNTNNYGTITNDNSTINIQNDLWNLGQKTALGAASPSSVATISNNGGTITIGGDLYNGGQNFAQSVRFCQIGFCGGGNIINQGGTIEVKGQLVSQGKDGQNSSIQIYGGTLIVGGGLKNKEGSTLTFGILDGVMGKLQGDLINEQGQVVVDTEKVSVGQNYQIITGSATGLDDAHFSIINNPNSQFYEIDYDKNTGSISVKRASSGGGSGGGDKPPTPQPSKVDVFKDNLNSNEKGIFNALSSKFGGEDEFLMRSGVEVQDAISTTEKVVKESVIAQPQGMINAFQANALPLPTPKSIAVAKRTAASEIIRFDNGKRVSPFERKLIRAPKHRSVYFNPLGAILRGDNLKGYIAGFTLGSNYEVKNYASQIYFSYAYGASSQDFTTQSADTTGNLFQAGFLNRYSYSVFEMAMNANLLAGVFKIKNEWQDTTMLNSTANFVDYQLNLGLIAGAKLGDKLSFKPFVGIQNYLEMREKFKQNGGLEIESKGYNAYIIDGVLGVEARYVFNEFASVFGKFSFEDRLYNTHKTIFMWAFDNELKYDNKSYDNALSLNLGTQIYTWYDFNLDAELSYKHYNNGLNYFGGNLILKYAF